MYGYCSRGNNVVHNRPYKTNVLFRQIPEEQGGRSYFSRQYLQDTTPSDVMRTLHYPAMEADTTEEDAEDEVRIGR